jgi:glutamate dehydrogenase/leucine dehydrogenase
MIEILFERGAESIVVTELSRSRRAALLDRFADRPLRVELVTEGDLAIFADPCDVLIPSALGGVLSPKTIPSIQAAIVCGPANNALEDEVRDARALAARGISCVPDTIANRMGIVACCDEHAGHLSGDPMIARQLDGDAEHSIYGDVRRVLELAARDGTTPTEAANELADKAMNDPHPIHGDRAQRIVASLVASDWADSR